MPINGTIEYSSPSNIAIIKYWGKLPGQIPMNPSISMTLDVCRTFTRIQYKVGMEEKASLSIRFDGKESSELTIKTQEWLEKIKGFYPWLKQAQLSIDTRNNFPHSAGIASSASGMSALAMCIAGIDKHISNDAVSDLKQESNIARIGSGSASRSVNGPWMVWGQLHALGDSSDEYAIPFYNFHEKFASLRDSIIVVSTKPKPVSSRLGHSLMDDHPYRSGRLEQTQSHFNDLLLAMGEGNWEAFARITENEALSLHALMMSSEGGPILWTGETVEWLHYLRSRRDSSNIPMAFTLDAGANIHLLYPESAETEVKAILQESPVKSIEIIHDKAGKGPELISDKYEQL